MRARPSCAASAVESWSARPSFADVTALLRTDASTAGAAAAPEDAAAPEATLPCAEPAALLPATAPEAPAVTAPAGPAAATAEALAEAAGSVPPDARRAPETRANAGGGSTAGMPPAPPRTADTRLLLPLHMLLWLPLFLCPAPAAATTCLAAAVLAAAWGAAAALPDGAGGLLFAGCCLAMLARASAAVASLLLLTLLLAAEPLAEVSAPAVQLLPECFWAVAEALPLATSAPSSSSSVSSSA